MENAGPGPLFWIFYVVVTGFVIVSLWKVYVKAGKPGWASIVPIYNVIVYLEISKKPIWWIVLLFIPLVNIVIAILVSIEFAKHFGKGAGFGLGLAFLGFIFYPILAFDDSKYLPNETRLEDHLVS